MKSLQTSIWDNLNESVLTEKINKDNIEINRAIANPNAGNNAQRLKDMGYEVSTYNDGKVYEVRNPKTGKTVFPSSFSRDDKKVVDFKNSLDSDRPYNQKLSLRSEYVGRGKEIPNSVVVGKDNYGNKIVNSDDYNAYSSHTSLANPKPNYKSISKNVNDYKKSVSDRDENKNSVEYYKNSGRKYYADKVDKAQKELDWQDSYYADKEKKANDAEAKRKEIMDKVRNRNNTHKSEE